jgi:16S rRNA (cytidine1402-2'-O)-methyltransferase
MSKLILVPTPIGNLEDITLRAIRVLKEADNILAEDTRTTKKLLKHYGIENNLKSYHIFNEHKIVDGIVDTIVSGSTVALVTDAGTPGISDPGFLLVRACINRGVEVESLPGATAFVPALVNSGFPTERFFFEGFLPHKKGRKTRLEELSDMPYTLVFYESPFRLVKTLEQFAGYFGKNRRVSVSRELTKIHEETVRGTITEVIEYFKEKNIKGEIVIVVDKP